MDNFTVNLTIRDACCNNCFKCVNEKTLSISDTSTLIPLQDDFSLRIVAVTSTRITIEIRKSYLYFIRFAYINIDTNICLPCGNCCKEHILTIRINSITTS